MSIRALSARLQKTAERELNEDTKRLQEDLKYIEEWLTQQPHLNVRKDPQFLINFLRCSKFSLQRTKEKLDYFYTMKTLTPELFINKNPLDSELQELINNCGVFPIIKTTERAGLPTILLVRWKGINPQKVYCASVAKACLMCMDILLNENDNFAVNGLIILSDMKGFSLSFVKHLTPALCKKIVLSIQKAYPIRLKGIYFINTPPIYEVFVNMFVPFFIEKMRKRLKVIGEEAIDKLYEYIPLEVLPEEYGGNAGPISVIAGEYKQMLNQYQDWFIEDEQFGSNESRRPEKPKTSAEIFGVEGSFRQLVID